MAKSYSRAKGRSRSARYFGIPYAVTEHPNFVKLSAYGHKLLIDIGRQYSGGNNGDLCATWSVMVKRGWKSKETLNDALRELEYYGLVVITQYGDRKRPTLYGLSWLKIDKALGEFAQLVSNVPGNWKRERKLFIKPSARRDSKKSSANAKKSVTRYAGQTTPLCGSKDTKLETVK